MNDRYVHAIKMGVYIYICMKRGERKNRQKAMIILTLQKYIICI